MQRLVAYRLLSMAWNADIASPTVSNQEIPEAGTMGVMATRAGEFPTRPPPLLRSGDRVTANRMAPADSGQPGMTADA